MRGAIPRVPSNEGTRPRFPGVVRRRMLSEAVDVGVYKCIRVPGDDVRRWVKSQPENLPLMLLPTTFLPNLLVELMLMKLKPLIFPLN